jgi:putative ABC transport system permease protein
MGVGTIIAGLAAVIIGEAFVGRRSVFVCTLGVIFGSVVYRLAVAAALNFRFGALSLTPSDLNLITALMVLAALAFPRLRETLKSRALK